MGKGKRVEIPVYTDQWMRGDRYGEVVEFRGDALSTSYRVMLDKSGTLVWVDADDCKAVE